MNFDNIDYQKIVIKFTKINQSLTDLLLRSSLQDIFKLQKKISQQLLKLMQYARKMIRVHEQIKKLFQSSLQILLVIINSSQIQKYGLRFSFFTKLIQTYQIANNAKVSVGDQQRLFERAEKNQESLYCQQINSRAISSEQKNFPRTKRFQNFIKQLSQNQIVLPDQQCICCCRVFIKNIQIINNNNLYPNIIGISSTVAFDKHNLGKYINAVLNSQGGALIVGAEYKRLKLIPTGIKFQNDQQIMEMLAQIHQLVRLNNPPNVYSYKIDAIKLHSNYIQPKNISQQYGRFCIRILIKPKFVERIFFQQFQKKGYQKTFEIYGLNGKKHPRKIVFKDNKQNLYSFMHQTYRQVKSKYHLENFNDFGHTHLAISQPYMNYSKLYLDSIKNGYFIEQQPQQEQKDTLNAKGNAQVFFDDSPRFKYINTSLIVVSSKKNQRYLNDFQQILKSKKYLYQLQRPFPESFNQNGRYIYMLSHQTKHLQLKNLFNKMQVKVGAMLLMPVYKCLQIDKAKLNFETEAKIKKKFSMRYKRSFLTNVEQTIDQQTKQTTSKIYMSFDCLSEAIYGYLLFEQQQLKPYFIKQGTVFTKKKKNSQAITNY